MKHGRITKTLVIALAVMCLTIPSAEAKNKNKSKKSKKEATFMINGGFGLGLIVPGFDIYWDEWGDNYNMWSYALFGGYGVVNFGMTFDMGKKKKWSLGPAIQLGYKGEGGPFIGYDTKRGTKYSHTNPNDYYSLVKENDRAMHGFLADLCVAVKGNPAKSARLSAELGLRFGVVAMYEYTKIEVQNVEKESWSDANWNFVLGPSFFLGADAYVSDHFCVTPGFRFAAAFGMGSSWGYNTVTISEGKDRFGNPIPDVNIGSSSVKSNRSYIDLAFELKFNWYNKTINK